MKAPEAAWNRAADDLFEAFSEPKTPPQYEFS